jgi:hypothetical protein
LLFEGLLSHTQYTLKLEEALHQYLPVFLPQQVEVTPAVGVREEHVPAPVATLRHVMRHTRHDDPRNSGHTSAYHPTVKKTGSVPI